jgi:predicted translin family RNA/ssDNA-binding protein
MIYNSIEIKTNLHGGTENMDYTRETTEEIRQLEEVVKFLNETVRKNLLEEMHWINQEWTPNSEISNLKYRRDMEEVQMKLDVNYILLEKTRQQIKILNGGK